MDMGKNFRPGHFGVAIPFFTNDSGVDMGKNFIWYWPRGVQGGSLLVAVGTKQACEWGKILFGLYRARKRVKREVIETALSASA